MSTALQSQRYRNHHFGQIDLYTYGDPEFKPMLIDSMIGSLQELQQSLYVSTKECDPSVFLRAANEAKTTLGILDNIELSTVVSELKSPADRRKRIVIFDELCEEIIRCLREDKELNENQLTTSRHQ